MMRGSKGLAQSSPSRTIFFSQSHPASFQFPPSVANSSLLPIPPSLLFSLHAPLFSLLPLHFVPPAAPLLRQIAGNKGVGLTLLYCARQAPRGCAFARPGAVHRWSRGSRSQERPRPPTHHRPVGLLQFVDHTHRAPAIRLHQQPPPPPSPRRTAVHVRAASGQLAGLALRSFRRPPARRHQRRRNFGVRIFCPRRSFFAAH